MPIQRRPGWTLLAEFSVPLPIGGLLSRVSAGAKDFPKPPPLTEPPLPVPILVERKKDAKEMVKRGIDSFFAYRFDEARTILRGTLDLDCYNWEAHKCLADALYTLGRYPEAISHYKQALVNSPLDGHYSLRQAQISERIGDSYRNLGDSANSSRCYRSALKLLINGNTPDLARHRHLSHKLGKAYNEGREFSMALSTLNTAGWSEDDADTMLEASIALAGLGEKRKAERLQTKAFSEYQKLIDINPDNPTPYLLRARAYQKLGRMGLTQSDFMMCEQLVRGLDDGGENEILPDRADSISSGTLYEAADRLRHDGRFGEAAQAFRRVTWLEPKSGAAYCLLGECYQKLGRYAEALRSYEAAEKLGVKDLHIRIGECDFALNRFEAALKSFRKAIGQDGMLSMMKRGTRNDMFTASTYLWIGQCHSMMNKQAKALEFFRKALRICDKVIEGPHNASGGPSYLELAEIYLCRAMANERLGFQGRARMDYQSSDQMKAAAQRSGG